MAAEHEASGEFSDIDETEEVTKKPNFLLNISGIQNYLEGHMQQLPKPVKRRIKALKKLQLEHTNIKAKFYQEIHALECKYNNLCYPLYEKRHAITSGGYEPNDDECDFPSDDEENLTKELTDKVNIKEVEEPKAEIPIKGIPGFWLTVFKNTTSIGERVQPHDEPILKHLIDIKVSFVEEPMGFKLHFHFEPNEYFTNAVLTKEYDMKCVPEASDPFSFAGPEVYKRRGCIINWNKGKNVTIKTVIKKQKHKNRGIARTVKTVVQNDSFFNFFTPPTVPEDLSNEDVAAELITDFEIGHYIKERIVPRAVLYFTGEGSEDEDEDYEEEEEEEEEDDDDDEISSDGDENKKNLHKENCKQQ